MSKEIALLPSTCSSTKRPRQKTVHNLAGPLFRRGLSGRGQNAPLDLLYHWTYTVFGSNIGGIVMSRTSSSMNPEKRRTRGSRLGFRVDAATKKLVARAAALERRSLTDFCLRALTEATQATITRHETIVLSERDREVFFDALVPSPSPNARLKRAFQSAHARIDS